MRKALKEIFYHTVSGLKFMIIVFMLTFFFIGLITIKESLNQTEGNKIEKKLVPKTKMFFVLNKTKSPNKTIYVVA